MTKLNIQLDPGLTPQDIPDIPEGADRKLAQFQPYLDQLAHAIASPNGIKLIFKSPQEAKGMRLKFYRARRYVNRQGVASFNKVTLLVDDCALLLQKDTAPQIELL